MGLPRKRNCLLYQTARESPFSAPTAPQQTAASAPPPSSHRLPPVKDGSKQQSRVRQRYEMLLSLFEEITRSTRACLQLGGLCTRTDQNQTRNAVLFCSAAGMLGIPKSV